MRWEGGEERKMRARRRGDGDGNGSRRVGTSRRSAYTGGVVGSWKVHRYLFLCGCKSGLLNCPLFLSVADIKKYYSHAASKHIAGKYCVCVRTN